MRRVPGARLVRQLFTESLLSSGWLWATLADGWGGNRGGCAAGPGGGAAGLGEAVRCQSGGPGVTDVGDTAYGFSSRSG